MDRLIGVRAGNYEITSWIGGGGMGDVYRAVHVALGSRVAIKVLKATAEADPHAVERLMREAKAVNRIAHDGVVKIMDGGRLPTGEPYLVMELLDGEDFAQRLERTRPLPVREACELTIGALDAVAAAHACAVVHRDLKPANLLVTRTGRVVVLDFGLAQLIETNSPARLTLTGVVMGTPAYMSPEQIRGEPVGPEVDIYAMGVTLYELVCGKRPFAAATAELTEHHLEHGVELPDTLPAPIRAVIEKALARSVHDRFETAAAMRLALQAAIARPPRSRLAWILAAGALAIGATIAMVAATRSSEPDDAPPTTIQPTPVQHVQDRIAPPPPPPQKGCQRSHNLACTTLGPVTGSTDRGVTMYRDIPFAKPPIGPLRWAPPVPLDPWTTPAVGKRVSCAHTSPNMGEFGDEDCLYLDVYAPESATLAPIVVFLHGGDDRGQHDANQLARAAGVVVVVPNYRLGVFGWLAHPALGKSPGNYGLRDQLAAIQWAHDNAGAFGGDPKRLTLLGQSDGAIAGCDLLAIAPELVAGAWLMSGSCFAYPLEALRPTADAVVKAVGCKGDLAACLRAKSTTELLRIPNSGSSEIGRAPIYYPAIDGELIVEQPLTTLNRTWDGPLVIGTTDDELLNLIDELVLAPLVTPADYKTAIDNIYGAAAPAVLATYPLSAYPSPREAVATVLSDQLAHCPARRLARSRNPIGGVHRPVWRYVFTHHISQPIYGLDLYALFGDWRFKNEPPTTAEGELSSSLALALGTFASTGALDHTWQRYSARSDFYTRTGLTHATRDGFHPTTCDAWDSVVK